MMSTAARNDVYSLLVPHRDGGTGTHDGLLARATFSGGLTTALAFIPVEYPSHDSQAMSIRTVYEFILYIQLAITKS
jgi:hypothetical protein